MQKNLALLIEKNSLNNQTCRFISINEGKLMDGNVLVKVHYSTLNYKDGLAITGKRPVVKRWPMIPGVDFSGKVIKSSSKKFLVGDKVVLNGWGVGEKHFGGFSSLARVNSDWLIHLPKQISLKYSMAIGSAGLTAMLCVMEIEKYVRINQGEILVTGATGGVGSIAIILLNSMGYNVVAATGKLSETSSIMSLGAKRVINREVLNKEVKQLDKRQWAGVIDVVGSKTLANCLTQTNNNGLVVSCGLVQDSDLPVSVMPFIIRAIKLIGVESIQVSRRKRITAWNKISKHMDFKKLDLISKIYKLNDVKILARKIVQGKIKGRTIIKI